MDEINYRDTVIQVVKYDSSYRENDDLLPLLEYSSVVLVKRRGFARYGQWNQRLEDVEIRVPAPLIDTAHEKAEVLEKLFRYVYTETPDYVMNDFLIKPLVMEPNYKYVKHDVYFAELKDKIIQGIRNAKYTIWIVMAWFTDDDILNELLAKKADGVNVRVVISDEKSNSKMIEKLQKAFEVAIVPKHGFMEFNRTHDKFCVIDFEYVMHGSYNWTKTAEYDDETLEVALDREMAKEFSKEFIRLLNTYKLEYTNE